MSPGDAAAGGERGAAAAATAGTTARTAVFVRTRISDAALARQGTGGPLGCGRLGAWRGLAGPGRPGGRRGRGP